MLFKVCNFLGTPKSQTRQHKLVLKIAMLTNHRCYSLKASRKWFTRPVRM